MKPVVIRNTVIGEGKPKICIPIVAVSKEEILAEAKSFAGMPFDVVEWRCDWFEEVFDPEAVEEVLKGLREILKDAALLMTFRTAKEGGQKSITAEEYAQLNISAAKTGCVDLVDVEAFSGDAVAAEIIAEVHACGVKVIASNHDFHATPVQEEIVRRLRRMQELGADIAKIAVMPQSRKDVITLLAATEEMTSQYAEIPVITMSMSAAGVISRIAGEAFGSALTFGAAHKASAPGQMGVHDLNTVLDLLHQAM